MGEVVELHQVKQGDFSFMACPCTAEPTPFVVLALVGSPPIICGLVCPECDQQLDVVNGIVQRPVDAGG